MRSLHNDQFYALKAREIHAETTDRAVASSLAEIKFLQSSKHPHVIQFIATFFDEPTKMLCLVMEHASGGNLSQRIASQRVKKAFFGESTILKYLAQVALGVQELHRQGIMHLDLKVTTLDSGAKTVVERQHFGYERKRSQGRRPEREQAGAEGRLQRQLGRHALLRQSRGVARPALHLRDGCVVPWLHHLRVGRPSAAI